MAPEAPTLGARSRRRRRCARARGHTADEIEEEEAPGAHGALEVVPENPQIEHVPSQVHPSAVEEHRGDKRGPEGHRDHRWEIPGRGVFARHHAPRLDERLQRPLRSLAKLNKEGEHIENYQCDRDDWRACARFRDHRLQET